MHTSRCSNSTSSRCTCSCGGGQHGVAAQGPWRFANPGMGQLSHPSWRDRAPAHAELWVNDRVAEYIARIVDLDGDVDAAMVSEVADVVQEAVEAAVATLPRRQRKALHREAGSHLVCTLLAGAVQVLAPFADADQLIAQAVARAVAPHATSLPEALSARLLQDMVARIVDLAGHTTLAKAKGVVRLMRIAAFALCPAPDHHKAVRGHCLAPLGGEGSNRLVMLLGERALVDPRTAGSP
jgi:hypothetical protein